MGEAKRKIPCFNCVWEDISSGKVSKEPIKMRKTREILYKKFLLMVGSIEFLNIYACILK
jgi:hypothetical protein